MQSPEAARRIAESLVERGIAAGVSASRAIQSARTSQIAAPHKTTATK